ncbi:hypothetical protein AB0I60_11240 [Actinosynnema sp. NPDC050436]|uniref:hypothetical protein n=1 Tax=Actinosynnema sp. NPDC050436 TaxID=3155659 RepID=UPI0033EDA639
MRGLLIVPAVLLAAGCSASAGGGPDGIGQATGSTASTRTVVVGDVPVLRPDGFAPVRLGARLDELRAAGEVGDLVEDPTVNCPVHRLVNARGWVAVEGGVVVRMRVEARVRTPEGLRLGDSRARLRELYPDAVQDPHRFTLEVTGNTRYEFYFLGGGDTLTAIGTGRPDTGC